MARGIPNNGTNNGWFQKGYKRPPRIITVTPLAERFWSKVQKCDGCWLWLASCDRKGYGQFMMRENGKPRLMRAHRVAWELTNGPIPDGMFLCHHCDVRRCVHPGHMFLGTNDDNVADMVAKGRGVTPPRSYGEEHKNAKLTNGQVVQIRKSVSNGVRQCDVARQHKVSASVINSIVMGRTWRTVQ